MLKLGFIIFDEIQAMDVVAPYELLDVWQNNSTTEIKLELILISEKDKDIICSNSHFKLQSDCTFSNAPDLDYLLVPGGIGRMDQMNNTAMLAFIKAQYEKCNLILSVCTGTFLLLKSGVLDNKRATTYWRALPELAKIHPSITQNRIVKDGKIWTAGGISSGLDLALEFIKEIAGESEALKARLLFEYFPEASQKFAVKNLIEDLTYYGDHKNTADDIPEYIHNLLKNNY